MNFKVIAELHQVDSSEMYGETDEMLKNGVFDETEYAIVGEPFGYRYLVRVEGDD